MTTHPTIDPPDLFGRKSPERLARDAMATFHLGVGRAGEQHSRVRDDRTLALFPLVLILDADGTLAADVRGLVERLTA